MVAEIHSHGKGHPPKVVEGRVHRKTKVLSCKMGNTAGGIISPTLANITLDGLEGMLTKHFGSKDSKKRKSSSVHLIRYADDFIITSKTKEILAEKVMPLLEAFLSERGLTLSKEKTSMTHVKEGFDFLSQNVRKYKTSLIIKPSKSSIKNLLNRVRDEIKKNRAQTQAHLIDLLNPLIRGWGNYHKSVCARKTFEKVDHEIFQALWRWSKRRHPNKGLRWIKDKYFKIHGRQSWCFVSKLKYKNKNSVELKKLFKTTSLPIRRHRKIIAQANPFDKEWSRYFAERARKYTMSFETSNNHSFPSHLIAKGL